MAALISEGSVALEATPLDGFPSLVFGDRLDGEVLLAREEFSGTMVAICGV